MVTIGSTMTRSRASDGQSRLSKLNETTKIQHSWAAVLEEEHGGKHVLFENNKTFWTILFPVLEAFLQMTQNKFLPLTFSVYKIVNYHQLMTVTDNLTVTWNQQW